MVFSYEAAVVLPALRYFEASTSAPGACATHAGWRSPSCSPAPRCAVRFSMRLVRARICRDEEPVSRASLELRDVGVVHVGTRHLVRGHDLEATTACEERREASRRDAVSEQVTHRAGVEKQVATLAKPEPIGFCRGGDARRCDAADARATRPRRWKPLERAIIHHTASSARAFGEATHRWAARMSCPRVEPTALSASLANRQRASESGRDAPHQSTRTKRGWRCAESPAPWRSS